MTNQKGFTLIEIAIVLVIIGLLLGGVLKGQELITSAKVRNIISQQDGIKAAYFGFQDRYRAIPGDYAQATANIKDTLVNGDGNGIIEIAGSSATGKNETIGAWDHLSHAGFINGSYIYNATDSDTSTPKNAYNAYLQIIHDAVYADTAAPNIRLNLKTGNQIPVEILAEIDRKIDDAIADRGIFRYSSYVGAGAALVDADCYNALGGAWLAAKQTVNCGGASLF